MNRDELAAFARGSVYVLAGAAVLFGTWLLCGSWLTGAVVVVGIGAGAWDAWRRPWWWLW